MVREFLLGLAHSSVAADDVAAWSAAEVWV